MEKVALFLITQVFSRVFRTTKNVAREMGPQLETAIQGVAKIGAKRMREVILALPLLVLFVRELLRRRGEIQAQKQLFIIGAAASLSTLGLIILGSTLGSLPVQIGLLFTYPWLGIPLLISGGLTIAAIVIVLVWIIVYALNFVLAEDPAFRKIRDEFLSPDAKAALFDIQKEIEGSGADLEKMRTVVERQLKKRGAKGNPKKLDKMLTRFESRLSPKIARVSDKVSRKSQRVANAEHKARAS